MDDEIKKWLFDIENSIESIYEYLGEKKDFNSFCTHKVVKRAVEREFEIIGEALNRILKADEAIAITDSRKIVNLRNYIIHAYDNVVDEILWGIIIKHLPKLEKEVIGLLKDGGSQTTGSLEGKAENGKQENKEQEGNEDT
jgi:uncharacterized protein with HEPN domain